MTMAGPSARRAASSSTTMPMTPTTMSGSRRQAGAHRQRGLEDIEVERAADGGDRQNPVVERDVAARRVLPRRETQENEKDGEGEMDESGSAESFRMKMCSQNGSGEAIHSWKSDQATGIQKSR